MLARPRSAAPPQVLDFERAKRLLDEAEGATGASDASAAPAAKRAKGPDGDRRLALGRACVEASPALELSADGKRVRRVAPFAAPDDEALGARTLYGAARNKNTAVGRSFAVSVEKTTSAV